MSRPVEGDIKCNNMSIRAIGRVQVFYCNGMCTKKGMVCLMGCQWFSGSMVIEVGSGVLTDMLPGDTDVSHRLFVLREFAASSESERC
jgi:hypothetical protein